MSSLPETHYFPTVAIIDSDYSAFARTVESSPLQTWSHHKLTQSFTHIDFTLCDEFIKHSTDKSQSNTLDELISFYDGVAIGLELGRRVLGRGFDGQLEKIVDKENVAHCEDPILERTCTTKFDKLHAIGGVSSCMMPALSEALRISGEASQLGESRIKTLQAGMGYIAGNIIKVQSKTSGDLDHLSYHYGDLGFDEQQLEELYK